MALTMTDWKQGIMDATSIEDIDAVFTTTGLIKRNFAKKTIIEKYAERSVAGMEKDTGAIPKEKRDQLKQQQINLFSKRYDQIVQRDIASLFNHLHLGNKQSVAMYNEVMGKKNNSLKAIRQSLREIDPQKYDALMADINAKKKEKREEENRTPLTPADERLSEYAREMMITPIQLGKIKKILREKFNYPMHGIKTRQQFIEDSVSNGARIRSEPYRIYINNDSSVRVTLTEFKYAAYLSDKKTAEGGEHDDEVDNLFLTEREKLERDISDLKGQLKKEKQFNRKIELNTIIKKLERQLSVTEAVLPYDWKQDMTDAFRPESGNWLNLGIDK